jgi:hypothetical protein
MFADMAEKYTPTTFDAAMRHLKSNLDVIIRKQTSIEKFADATDSGLSIFSTTKVLQFEDMVQEWLVDYTKIMRTFPQEGISGLSINGIFHVQEFCRMLHYVQMPNEYFELKPYREPLHFLACGCIQDARIYIGSRVNWIEQRTREGQNPYGIAHRYSNLVTHQPSLLSSLREDRKWIVDWAIIPEVEIHCLIILVGNVYSYHSRIDMCIGELRQQHSDTRPKVDEITIDWTREAMVTTDKTCEICTYNFGPTFSDEWVTEPAVKTACNHVIGKLCLQNWINEHSTCPFCRRELYDRLPAAARPLHGEMLEERRMLAELDEEIDGFFLVYPKVIYGRRMETLLQKLKIRYQEAIRINRALDTLVIT